MKRLVSDEALQSRVFVLECLQPLGIADLQIAVALLLGGERLPRDILTPP